MDSPVPGSIPAPGGRKGLDFIAFPVRIGGNGWLVRSRSPGESIAQVLRIMVSTPRDGWRGSAAFGMRDILAALRARHDVQLTAVKQMNQTLEDLGIDWVRVEAIVREPATTPYHSAYVLTLAFAGRGSEVHRVEI
jgi:hypothetical protein